jgi:hypothetical protein
MKAYHVGLVIGAILIGSVAYNIGYLNSRDSVVATVTDKERIQQCDSDGGCKSKYLIFTDKETLENTDNLFVGKFNSSDYYGSIEQGKTYRFEVLGWRIPFFSTYRNIVAIQSAE